MDPIGLKPVLEELPCFLEVLGKSPFPYVFQLLEAMCIPWPVASFLVA